MELVLTEEQSLLPDGRGFCDRAAPLGRLRALRDSRDPLGYSRALWREMAKLGWLGILFPEEYGGSGLGFAEW